MKIANADLRKAGANQEGEEVERQAREEEGLKLRNTTNEMQVGCTAKQIRRSG